MDFDAMAYNSNTAPVLPTIRPLQIQTRNPLRQSIHRTAGTSPPSTFQFSRLPSHRSVHRNPYKARVYPHARKHTRTQSKSDMLRASVFETAKELGLQNIDMWVTEGAAADGTRSAGLKTPGGRNGEMGDDERSAGGVIEEEDETYNRNSNPGLTSASSSSASTSEGNFHFSPLPNPYGSDRLDILDQKYANMMLCAPRLGEDNTSETSERGRTVVRESLEEDKKTSSKSKEKKGWRRGKSAKRGDDSGDESATDGGYLSEAFGFRRKKKSKSKDKDQAKKEKKNKEKVDKASAKVKAKAKLAGTMTDVEGLGEADVEDDSDNETNASHGQARRRRLSLAGAVVVGSGEFKLETGPLFTTTTMSTSAATTVTKAKHPQNADDGYATDSYSQSNHSHSTHSHPNNYDFLAMPPPNLKKRIPVHALDTSASTFPPSSYPSTSSPSPAGKLRSKKYFGLFKVKSVPLAASPASAGAETDGRSSQEALEQRQKEKREKEPSMPLPIAERFRRSEFVGVIRAASPSPSLQGHTQAINGSASTSATLGVPHLDTLSGVGSVSAPVTRAASPMVGASASEGGSRRKLSSELWNDQPLLQGERKSNENANVNLVGMRRASSEQTSQSQLQASTQQGRAAPVDGQLALARTPSPRSPLPVSRSRSPFMVPINPRFLQTQSPPQSRKGSLEHPPVTQMHSPSSSTSVSSINSGMGNFSATRSSNTSATSASISTSPTRSFAPLMRSISPTKERGRVGGFLSPMKEKEKDGGVRRSITISAPNPHLATTPNGPPSPLTIAEALASRPRQRPSLQLQPTGPNSGLLRPARSPGALSPLTPVDVGDDANVNRAGIGAGRQFWSNDENVGNDNNQDDDADSMLDPEGAESGPVRLAPPRSTTGPDSPVIPSSAFLVPSPLPSPLPARPGFSDGAMHQRASVLAYYDIPPPSPPPMGPLPSLPRDQDNERDRELDRVRKRVGFADEGRDRGRTLLPPNSRTGNGRAPSPLSLPRSPSPYLDTPRPYSPNSRSATPTQGLYSQPIPVIHRGKESPFPSRPILPREESRNLVRRPSAAVAAAVRDARRAKETGESGIATGQVAVSAYNARVARYRNMLEREQFESDAMRPDSPLTYDIEHNRSNDYEPDSPVDPVSDPERDIAPPSRPRPRGFTDERPRYAEDDAATIGARSSVYSHYSIMDPNQSADVRDRFVKRVEEVYGSNGDGRHSAEEDEGWGEDVRESVYGGIARESVPPVPTLKPGLASLRMRTVSPTVGMGMARGVGVGRGAPAGRVMPLQAGSNRF